MIKFHSKMVRQGLVGLTVACSFFSFAVPSLASSVSVESQLSVARTESVKISNIDDWLIGVFTSNATVTNSQFNWDWQCVFASTGTYRIEVTSANGGSRLTLQSSAGDQMEYLIFAYYRRGSGFRLSGHNTPVINLNNLGGSLSTTCADEIITGTNLGFAASVSYTHLTLPTILLV